eukprot:763332-Hanusia_phi.AAC.2
MAPEVCSRGEYDYKADIWSLGITVIEMILSLPPLAHLHPIEAIEYIRQNDPPVLRSILEMAGMSDTWPQSLHDFVRCCLVKEFESRPSANELSQKTFILEALKYEENDLKVVDEVLGRLQDVQIDFSPRDSISSHVSRQRRTLLQEPHEINAQNILDTDSAGGRAKSSMSGHSSLMPNDDGVEPLLPWVDLISVPAEAFQGGGYIESSLVSSRGEPGVGLGIGRSIVHNMKLMCRFKKRGYLSVSWCLSLAMLLT